MNHSIFAIELCLRMEPGSRLRSQLRELVVSHPATSTPRLQWELLTKVSRILVESQALFEMGCWDFFDDDGRALRDYEMWSKGMTTEEGARTTASGPPEGTEPRFMTFTIALLLVAGSHCERDIAKLCTFPQDQLWKRPTFAKILRGLERVNFAAVKSDVIYLIPGDESWGLTSADLQQTKFEYLRPIV